MSLTTLANTKWLLDNSIQFDPQYPFQGAEINFVSNSNLYTYLDVTDDHYSEIGYGTAWDNLTTVYTNSAWVNSAYRTVYFIDGNDIDDAYVIDWVEDHGTQIDVDVEAVNADALDGALKGVAKAIRTKGGTSSGLVFPGGFVTAIENIPTGGGGDATATAMLNGTISGAYTHSSVTSLRPYALADCSQLTGVNFPACTHVGNQAFIRCIALTDISLPACSYVGDTAFYHCEALTNVSLPVCSYLGTTAFGYCGVLQTLSLPSVTSVGSQTFLACAQLSTISMPLCPYITSWMFGSCYVLSSLTMAFSQCTIVGEAAFYSCNALPSLNLPICTSIGSRGLQYCSSLSIVSLPACQTVQEWAFGQCLALTSIELPQCTTLYSNVFWNCTALTTVSLPKCTAAPSRTFYSCTALTNVYLPSCTTLGSDTFGYCTALTTLSLPKCTTIPAYAFQSAALQSLIVPACSSMVTSAFFNCTTIAYVYAPALRLAYSGVFKTRNRLNTVILSSCSVVGSSCFSGCTRLLSLYLLSTAVCKLSNINAFLSTPISTYTTATGGVRGSIFVRASLYATYIASTNWVNYSARFVSLTDAEIAQILIYG